MFSALLLIFLLQLFFVLYRRRDFRQIRRSVLETFVLTAVFIVFTTETLSLLKILNSNAALYWWTAANIGLLVYILARSANFGNDLSRAYQSASQTLADWGKTPSQKMCFVMLALIYSVVLVIAVSAPPNTLDSLSYHLARVAHWIQAGSVDYYPTSTLRQLYQNPLAEYVILHLQLLSGTDHYANLVQFFAFIGCGAAVSLIVGQFRQNHSTQLLSVLLTATIPMAILQASSTQNDLVLAFFTVSFFYFFLEAAETRAASNFLYAGLALGAALLTKGTGYIYCFPMGALIFGMYFFNGSSKAEKVGFAGRTMLLLLLAVTLNAGHYTRNYQLFGTPLSTGEDKVTNRNLSAPMLFSNLARNYFLHLEMSLDRTPSFLEHAAESLVGAEELNNPDSTYLNIPFSVVYSQHEDLAGNLVHTFLLTVFLWAVFFYRGEKKHLVWMSGICVLAGFVLFCAVLRWQPWASRLQLPLFIFGCTFLSVMLARFNQRFISLMTAVCFVSALPVLLLGQPRPVISNNGTESVLTAPRQKQYMANLPKLSAEFLIIAKDVEAVLKNPKHQQMAASLPNLVNNISEAKIFLGNAGAEEVGLFLVTDYEKHKFAEWEYMIWIGLKEKFDERPLIRHVGVGNVSARLAAGQPPPAYIITNGNPDLVEGVRYETAWRGSILRILRRAE